MKIFSPIITGSSFASGSLEIWGAITANYGPNTVGFIGTSSYSNTASFYQETDPIFTAKSASLATTGSNHFNGNQVITGSLDVSGSFGLYANDIDPGDPPNRVGLFYFTNTNFYVSLQ